MFKSKMKNTQASRPSRRADKTLLTSLLVDTAHQSNTAPGQLVVRGGNFPVFTLDDGSSRPLINYPILTEENVSEAFVASIGPCNPGDGPFGVGEKDETLYRLRGTDLHFSIASSFNETGQIELTIRKISP